MPQIGNSDFVNVVISILFGIIGFAAFLYGKKSSLWRPMVIGIVLMGYPYFFSNTLVIFLIGSILTVGLFFWRE